MCLIMKFCTQDQNDKLSKDYQAVSRDRGFMTESMTALKKREEELIAELLQCKVCINIPTAHSKASPLGCIQVLFMRTCTGASC